MTIRFVSFQAIFKLIHAENSQRPVREKPPLLNNRTVPFPEPTPTNPATKIGDGHLLSINQASNL